MTQLAEKLHPWVASTRPSGGPRWLQDLRERGAARFSTLGFPTVRDEEWRFTNVAPIASGEFRLADGDAPVTEAKLSTLLYSDAPHRLVVVDGRYNARLARV